MALVYVNRLTGYTHIRLHNANWRPILLCSLLLAQKVLCAVPSSFCLFVRLFGFLLTPACVQLWDDKSLANIDFPCTCSSSLCFALRPMTALPPFVFPVVLCRHLAQGHAVSHAQQNQPAQSERNGAQVFRAGPFVSGLPQGTRARHTYHPPPFCSCNTTST